MSASDWNAVLSRLEVEGTLHPVTRGAIVRYEADQGFALPRSYTSFCEVIGPGDLVEPWMYRITAPGAKIPAYNLSALNIEMGTWDRSPIKDSNRFKRARFFATEIGNNVYFWDPAESTDADDHEYAVWVMYEDYSTERLADTFWQFVNDTCLTLLPPGCEPSELKLTFIPANDALPR